MLTIQNLHAAYGKVEVLHGISLDVPKGKVVTLIGSNGAGKTTTMRAISGMLKPKGGSVLFGGKDVTGMDSYRIARAGLAHSPEGRRVFSTMSVKDNLLLGAFPRFTRSRTRGDIDTDLGQALELFPRLKERQNQLAGTLSGGEQQMLAMARALMSRPQLLLLDEPSMGLAPIMVGRIFQVVRDIAAQGVTVLLVEQNARLALQAADRGYVMDSGLITMAGAADELLHDPKVREAYLGEACEP
ncbi:ABC transporter ATP-binding protein [Noviherbaspirillum sp.]|uniref:ABC transporter ATP-binding protein n=1 Tax=Noviherbaspirillum sp. TaxID=1926288 RepID=UPI002B49E37A|nr:ABC transporter ATP-binding protein [Noviherbaspirillum sp.]HJV81818.1 ABC transporter ATP-binding protein [Noviherbaspirillum sp.]